MNKDEIHNLVKEQQSNICQIVAIKNNKIVYSDTWNNYKTTDNVHIASVTKSIISILVGIAIDKGIIPAKVWEDKALFQEFCSFIEERGIQRYWDENNLEAGYARAKERKTFA